MSFTGSRNVDWNRVRAASIVSTSTQKPPPACSKRVRSWGCYDRLAHNIRNMSSVLKTSSALTVRNLLSAPEVARALRFLETNAEAITDEQIRICSIPASPFNEQERAGYLSKRFSALGLSEVEIDEEGNCLGLLEGTSRLSDAKIDCSRPGSLTMAAGLLR